MKKLVVLLTVPIVALLAGCSSSQPAASTASSAPAATVPAAAPLTLLARYDMPGDPAGHLDHVVVDAAGQRLFNADEGGAITVVDLKTGKLIHTITADKEPHGLVYRADVNRLYATDGEAGLLRVFDGKTYRQIAAVKLWPDADSVGYDPATHDIYVDSGGDALHQSFSHFSEINSDTNKLVHDMHIDGNDIEAMAIASNSPLIYLNVRSKAQIAVINRKTHKVDAVWPIQGANNPTAIALDEAGERLFVGCRSGQMIVFDTSTGKQLQALPIGKSVDDMVYSPNDRRIYAACDGAVYIFTQNGADQYQSVQVESGVMGKTAALVPDLQRYFVAVPVAGQTPARILAFQVN